MIEEERKLLGKTWRNLKQISVKRQQWSVGVVDALCSILTFAQFDMILPNENDWNTYQKRESGLVLGYLLRLPRIMGMSEICTQSQ